MNITLGDLLILPDALCRPNREHIRLNVEGLNYPYERGRFTDECKFFLQRGLAGGKWELNRVYFNRAGNKQGVSLEWFDEPTQALPFVRELLANLYPVATS